MTGKAFVCELTDHIEIEGADFLVRCEVAGETIVTSKDNAPGTVGLMFDSETVIDEEFLKEHNLFRDSERNSDKSKRGYFSSARVRPERFKGVKTTGFFLPLKDISPKYNVSSLCVGQQIDTIIDKPLCSKFVRKQYRPSTKGGKARENIVPNFSEHFDTDQLERNWPKIDYVPTIVTAKLHGTSARCGTHLIDQPKKWWHKLFGIEPARKYGFVVGSRRVVKYAEGRDVSGKESFYSENIWQEASEQFRDKLYQGETVYFEIVGFLPSGQPIMPGQETKKLKKFLDKDHYQAWLSHYGQSVSFSYGCATKEHEVYVYRVTQTGADGNCIDLSWSQVKLRCQELGVSHVPEICTIYPQGDRRDWHEIIKSAVESAKSCNQAHGIDTQLFPSTPFEGVCVRQESGYVPLVLKSKTTEFKILEGIIKEHSSDIETEN